MDLRSLETRSSPHDALACPSGLCGVPAEFESPVFAVSVEELMTIAQAVIGAEPRTKFAAGDEELQQLVFVQRSRVFRFPDTVWIQGVRSGSGTTVIIYSRSNYGYWDLGVNRRRVGRWLAKLTNNIGTPETAF